LSIAFPLLLLFVAIITARSTDSFLILALVVFSWIRSGICFPQAFGKRLCAELLLCMGGGLLVAGFVPHSMVVWGMGIWMFFLVQALYFVIFDENREAADVSTMSDSFEEARDEAERILSAGPVSF
jgi:hypothetical protein